MKVGIFEVNEVEEEVTAKLDSWFIDNGSYPGYVVVRGYIRDDVRKRWHNGEFIRSSALVDPPSSPKPGDVLRTLNSRYLLGIPRKEDSSGS